MDYKKRLNQAQQELNRRAKQGGERVKQFVNDPEVQTYALLGGGASVAGALGLGALSAYSDQANAYLPTDPLAVAGRMASNLLAGPSQRSVGTDPLANARNHVASAGDIVGTEEMLEALAVAEMQQMRDERKAAAAVIGKDLNSLGGVQAMIDARATKLMQQPIQKSDGSVGPMPYDQAQRYATEQVAMELRAGDVY